MSKLELVEETDLVNSGGVTSLTKFYKTTEAPKRVFKIRYEMSNGSPLGFNYKKASSEYTDGKWNNIEDISTLNMTARCGNYYDHAGALKECNEFFKLMEEKIEKLYL